MAQVGNTGLTRQPYQEVIKYSKKFLWSLVINSTLSGFIFGYQMGAFNISQDAVVDWLGWGSDSLALITVGSTLVPVGAAFGAMTGGASDRLGRRKFLLLLDIVVIVGSAINLIPTTPTFMIARFIGGFTAGAAAAVCPLYNAEYSPNKMRGSLGNVFQVQVTLGILIAYIVSLPILWLDVYWLIVIFAFPIIPAVIQILLFTYRFKNEPHPWSLKKEKFDDARAAIDQVYFETYAHDKYNKARERSKEKKESGASVGELLCNPKYRKEMFIGNFVSAFQNLSGSNLLVLYSTVMFTQGGDSSLGPYLTVVFGVVNWLATFPSIPLMKKGRRPLLIAGFFALFIFDYLIAIFALFDLSFIAQVIFVMTWVVVFELSPGPITWTYLSEILSDKAMSIAVTVNWITVVCVGAASNYMITMLGIPITFFIYGTLCLFGCLFNLTWTFETNGKDKADLRLKYFGYN